MSQTCRVGFLRSIPVEILPLLKALIYSRSSESKKKYCSVAAVTME
jgi:hypothetical protein